MGVLAVKTGAEVRDLYVLYFLIPFPHMSTWFRASGRLVSNDREEDSGVTSLPHDILLINCME